MTDKDDDSGAVDDPVAALGKAMGAAAQHWQESWSGWLGALSAGSGDDARPAPAPAVNADPAAMLEAQMELWRDFQALWASTTARMMGEAAGPVIAPEAGDNRFRDAEWSDNPVFDFLKQSYLLNARWLRRSLAGVEGLDRGEAEKLDFMGRQIVDAFSPANFALTNPVVLREMRETRGESLMRGMRQLAEDLKDSEHGLRPRQTDMDAFEVGGNVATAPGAVVYQNALIQLIQYEPASETVYRKPLLIVPPWINKFYILDLRPDNSFIRWAVARGYTVFVISWVNPDESHASLTFDDYLRDGILAALDAVERATGERQATAIGYCIGGTLLSAALAYMDAVGDERIGAATFFAAQADFADAGELRIFTDEAHMEALEAQVREQGYLDAANMAGTFNALRANDLIWHFVINNYLLGKEPPAFDLLFWNADSTNFPAELFIQYLRNMYQRNNLARPGGFELMGQSDRSRPGRDPDLYPGVQGGPHRARRLGVQADPAVRRAEALRARGLRPYRRRRQPAGEEEVPALAGRRRGGPRGLRVLVRRRGGASGLLVAGLASLAVAPFGQEDSRPQARRWRAGRDRARARVLRQAAQLARRREESRR